MPTPRKHNFKTKAKYRLLKTVQTQTDHFSEGEIVEFINTGYGRYEESTVFIFRNSESGETKSWFLNDKDADESSQLFQIL